MRRASRIVSLLLLALLFVSTPVSAQEPVVEAYLFYSESCPHCHEIWDNFLPPVLEEYGDRLKLERIQVDDLDGYRLMTYVDDVGGVPPDQRGVPQILIGERILIGSNAIKENFVSLLEQYLNKGGFDLPSREELARQMEAAEAAATPSAQAGATSSKPIYLAYFAQPGCEICSQAQLDLNALSQVYPQLVVETYSVVDDAPLAEWLGAKHGVPEDERQVGPAIYIGGKHLVEAEVTYEGIEALIRQHLEEGAPRTWEGWEADRAAAEARVVERYRSFGLLTVVAAGLVDGVNPCAFTTLVFFVSYLSMTGRGRRQVLAAGVAFTLGVFLTYLVIGLGLYRALAAVPALSTASKVIYGAMALVCLVLAGLSVYDFWRARRGEVGDMALKLPGRLRRHVNRAIRESMTPERAATAALIAGVVVSTVELACTGQVYLPTLMFVAGRPELRSSAVPLLAAYNLSFVVPLIVVFGVTAYGVGSDRLRLLLTRHTSTVKLLTAVLFLGLAAWMVTLVV